MYYIYLFIYSRLSCLQSRLKSWFPPGHTRSACAPELRLRVPDTVVFCSFGLESASRGH